MQTEITKKCADSLRSFVSNQFGIVLKSSHAHEIVAAYFGYSSRAALLADAKCPISKLVQAEFIILTPSAKIKERRNQLNGLPENLPEDLAEGVYLPLFEENLILRPIWPTFEELGSNLADQLLNSNRIYSSDLKVQRHGVQLEFEGDQVAVVVFREYVSPTLLLSDQPGKKGVVYVFNLKRVAGFIGYVKIDHHITEAETLDDAIVKMRDAYHQMITSAGNSNVVRSLETPEPNFSEWLAKQRNRKSTLGDLARKRGFDETDGDWPSYSDLQSYKDYLSLNNPPRGATAALESAWKSYQAVLKRKRNPNPVKPVVKPAAKNQKIRKIVYVKNVTPLHYAKRTVETFATGSKAWVSWEGSKAIPVTVTDVDERYYTFKVDRPLTQAGNEYYVRLDEVRSTPELACINHVTW